MSPRLVTLAILVLVALEVLRFHIDGSRFWKTVWSNARYFVLSLAIVTALFFVVGIFATGLWPWDPNFLKAGE